MHQVGVPELGSGWPLLRSKVLTPERPRYRKKLIIVFKDFKGANEKVDYRLLLVEAILDRSIRQTEFMKRVAHTMDDEHYAMQHDVYGLGVGWSGG